MNESNEIIDKRTTCIQCNNVLSGKQEKFCSRVCIGRYTSSNRRLNNVNGYVCKQCGKALYDTQRKFCTNKCNHKYKYENNKEKYNTSSYTIQKTKGLSRKLELINKHGGKCEHCGYCKNIATLIFHHINPNEKLFCLEMRNLASKPINVLYTESDKCKVLCHNCHTELHNPLLQLPLDLSLIPYIKEENMGDAGIEPATT